MRTRLIHGYVRDAQSGAPLAQVNIWSAVPDSIGTASDDDGGFALRLSTQPTRLHFSHIGYRKKIIHLPAGKLDTSLVVELKIRPLPSREIEVEAQRDNPAPATFRLHRQEIRDIPDFSNETLGAVKTLPGIASRNELQNSFQAQGGSADENLIVLEGVEISRPQRIRHSRQENISQLNSMLIEKMTFLAGGFTAQYGERLSSVLLAEYRDSSRNKFSSVAEFSLLGAGVQLESQLNSRLYLAAAARVADRGLILQTLETSGDISPKAKDVQWIASYGISQRHRLKLFGIFGNNDFAFAPRLRQLRSNLGPRHRTEFDGTESFTRQSHVIALKLNSQLNDLFSIENSIAIGQFEENENVDLTSATFVGDFLRSDTLVSTGSVFRNNQLDETMQHFRSALSWKIRPRITIDVGAQFVRRKYSDFLQENEQEIPTLQDSMQQFDGYRYLFSGESRITTTTAAMFSSITYRFRENLELSTGLRMSRYSPARETVIQPRLSLSWNVGNLTTFKFGVGRYSQPPQYREFKDIDNNLRLDTRSQKAVHVVAGVQHFKSTGSEYQLQLFYKNIDPFIPYRTNDLFIQYQPELLANARIHGFSFYWKGNVIPRISSWLSYTYLQGRQKIRDEVTSPLPTDLRHTFSAVLQDNMPKYPNSRAHLRIIVGSGFPYTPVGTRIDEQTGRRVFSDLRRNSLRARFYRRIDAGFSYTFTSLPHAEARIDFEIFNLFDYGNVLTYNAVIDGFGNASYLPIYLSRRLYNVKLALRF